jgi:splicing factor 3A subunit 1
MTRLSPTANNLAPATSSNAWQLQLRLHRPQQMPTERRLQTEKGPRSSLRVLILFCPRQTLKVRLPFHENACVWLNHSSPDIIARTASHVARSTTRQQFEDRIRESRREDPKFSFLNSSDPYHAYYKYRVERIIAGEEDEEIIDAAQTTKAMEVDKIVATIDEGEAPPLMDYVLSIPPMPAVDVDIMKLTALFVAQRGRSFLAALSQKEGRNYQFDFLRPTSALFGLFNRMVEQYRLVLLPPKETLAKIDGIGGPDGKWKKLAEIRRRAKWERIQNEKDKRREEDLEAERGECLYSHST